MRYALDRVCHRKQHLGRGRRHSVAGHPRGREHVTASQRCPACHGQGCEARENDDGTLSRGESCDRCGGSGFLSSNERAAFEQWVQATVPECWPNPGEGGERTFANGWYRNRQLHMMWLAWQAAWAVPKACPWPECPHGPNCVHAVETSEGSTEARMERERDPRSVRSDAGQSSSCVSPAGGSPAGGHLPPKLPPDISQLDAMNAFEWLKNVAMHTDNRHAAVALKLWQRAARPPGILGEALRNAEETSERPCGCKPPGFCQKCY